MEDESQASSWERQLLPNHRWMAARRETTNIRNASWNKVRPPPFGNIAAPCTSNVVDLCLQINAWVASTTYDVGKDRRPRMQHCNFQFETHLFSIAPF